MSAYPAPAAVRVTPTLAVPVIVALVNVGGSFAILTSAVSELITAFPGEIPESAVGITATFKNLPISSATGL